jgi:hypothetical protein
MAATSPDQRSVRTGPGLTAQKLILCAVLAGERQVRFWPAALAAPGAISQ